MHRCWYAALRLLCSFIHVHMPLIGMSEYETKEAIRSTQMLLNLLHYIEVALDLRTRLDQNRDGKVSIFPILYIQHISSVLPCPALTLCGMIG
jgi:hypothetical protein